MVLILCAALALAGCALDGRGYGAGDIGVQRLAR
jgi:hypothetical protein